MGTQSQRTRTQIKIVEFPVPRPRWRQHLSLKAEGVEFGGNKPGEPIWLEATPTLDGGIKAKWGYKISDVGHRTSLCMWRLEIFCDLGSWVEYEGPGTTRKVVRLHHSVQAAREEVIDLEDDAGDLLLSQHLSPAIVIIESFFIMIAGMEERCNIRLVGIR